MSRTLVLTCALAAFVCGLSAPAAAHTSDRRTYFTFNQPIALPGVTLPAGTYTFRLADPGTGRRVVQVLNDRGTQSHALLLSIPTYRTDVPENSEISFMETGAGMPAAVKTWWQEGSVLGYEFIYSRDQVRRLSEGMSPEPTFVEARSSTAAGPAAFDPQSPVESAQPIEQLVNGSSSTQAAEQQSQTTSLAPVTAQESTPATADPQAPIAAGQGSREALPQTASLMPFTMVLGTLMLAGGVWLMRRVKV